MSSNSKSRAKSRSQSPAASFKPGTQVEISSDDVGFRGSWYTGKIVKRASSKDATKFLVEYTHLYADEGGKEPLRESLHAGQLRPAAPREKEREFKFGEEVDAYYNDGWWEGTITGVKDGRFAVYFRSSKEQIEFCKEDLRLHREWLGGEWKPPLEEEGDGEEGNEKVSTKSKTKTEVTPNNVVGEKKLGKRKAPDAGIPPKVKFSKGTPVEVSSDEDGFKGAWFTATIVEPAGEDKYVIQYKNLRTDDDKDFLREEIDTLHIRPCPPETLMVDGFNRLDEVDALYNDGWWVGVISKVLSNSRYIVYFRESNEELQFGHSDLRLHQDWIDGKWVPASRTTIWKKKSRPKAKANSNNMQILMRKLLDRISTKQVFSNLVFQTIVRQAYSTRKFVDVGQPTPASHPQLMKEGEITPGISAEEYISRRKRLLELLPENSIAILAAAPVKMMTDVVPYPYRQEADYLYITGCEQPGGLAVLGHECGLCMFMPETSCHDVNWKGPVAGVEAALETFKAEKAYPMRKIHDILPDMILRSYKVFHKKEAATQMYTNLEAFQKADYYCKVTNLSKYTHQLRWVKSPAEVRLMRESASIACQALLQTMMYSKTHPYEAVLAAKFDYECKTRGAQRMAFHPVVGGGSNATVIHYSRNDQKIEDGDLVLMDVGCELHNYVSDITRTWPPCGCFSSLQEELYDLILQTNKECLELCKPGANLLDIHHYSVRMLRKGLTEIGIVNRNGTDPYNDLNPTSIGHYLGMDVHDSSMISYDRTLEPGVVITIEPGLYIPSSFDGPERFRGIGIRIEDDVLITETGHEVLTGSMPKEIKHIESLLNNFSHGMGMESCSNVKAATS